MERRCYFCDSKKIRLPEIGIAIGMGGRDYNFCFKCLKSMTADQFFRKLFLDNGILSPPRLVEESSQE